MAADDDARHAGVDPAQRLREGAGTTVARTVLRGDGGVRIAAHPLRADPAPPAVPDIAVHRTRHDDRVGGVDRLVMGGIEGRANGGDAASRRQTPGTGQAAGGGIPGDRPRVSDQGRGPARRSVLRLGGGCGTLRPCCCDRPLRCARRGLAGCTGAPCQAIAPNRGERSGRPDCPGLQGPAALGPAGPWLVATAVHRHQADPSAPWESSPPPLCLRTVGTGGAILCPLRRPGQRFDRRRNRRAAARQGGRHSPQGRGWRARRPGPWEADRDAGRTWRAPRSQTVVASPAAASPSATL